MAFPEVVVMPAIVGLSRAFCNPCDRDRSQRLMEKEKKNFNLRNSRGDLTGQRSPASPAMASQRPQPAATPAIASRRREGGRRERRGGKKNLGSRACSQVSSELTSEHHPHEEERRGRGRGRGEERKKGRILILEFSIRQPKERRREEKRRQERGQQLGDRKEAKRRSERIRGAFPLLDWETGREKESEEKKKVKFFLSSVNLNSFQLEGSFACFFGFLLLSYALLSHLPSLLSSPVLGDEYKEQYCYPILP